MSQARYDVCKAQRVMQLVSKISGCPCRLPLQQAASQDRGCQGEGKGVVADMRTGRQWVKRMQRKNRKLVDAPARLVVLALLRAPQLSTTVSLVAGAGPEPAYPTTM